MYWHTSIKLGTISLLSIATLAGCGEEVGVEPEEDAAIDTTLDEGITDTADSEMEDTSDESSSDSVDDSQVSMGLETIDVDVSLEDAINQFNETFSDPMIESIQFDEENGDFVYDIEGFDSSHDYEMRLSAETGEILSEETEEEDNDDTNDNLNLTNIIEPEEAMDRALEYVGSGYVEEWELTDEDGMTVYEIDLEDTEDMFDDDVKVNAQTGDINE